MITSTTVKPFSHGRTAQRFIRKIGPAIESLTLRGISNLELKAVSRAGWRLTFDCMGRDGGFRQCELDASVSMSRTLKDPVATLLTLPSMMGLFYSLPELSEPSPTARASIECWSCNNSVTLEARSMNDGLCPVCFAEIELYE